MFESTPTPSRRLAAVVGHRGAGKLAPENTLAALRAAASMGLAWVEFDARLTADGVPVLLHDPTLDRTTDGHGAIDRMAVQALRGVDAGGWFGPQFAGEPVPTLEQALACLADLGLAANIEIKAESGRGGRAGARIAAAVARLWPADLPPPVLSSFDEDALAAAAETAPALERALIVGAVPPDWAARLGRLGCRALHAAVSPLDEETAAAVVSAGVALRVYTVNDPATAERLFACGVESVFTDRPDRLLGRWPAA
ncbi:MAG: glycerophosphodiester phosphodiesterase [Defluviicoccus sp.]